MTLLDPADPFEAAMIGMVELNRRKRADYALDGDIFSNFRQAAAFAGVDVHTVLNVMLGIKQARLLALEANGRGPLNESVADSVADRAVYAVIALALHAEASDVSAVDPRTYPQPEASDDQRTPNTQRGTHEAT